MLDDRKTRLLKAIIDDYIQTAVPVASRTLSKKHDFGLSSATIRNEMSDLEELGFLEQPHTSAGRIPSLRAYRLYVDTMMRMPKLSAKEISVMRAYFSMRIMDIQTIVAQTAQVLAELTAYPAIVMADSMGGVVLKHIQLVPVAPGSALLLLVTDAGVHKDTIVPIPKDIDYGELDTLSNMLNSRFRDVPLAEAAGNMVDAIGEEFAGHREIFEAVLQSVTARMAEQTPPEMALGGTRNIFQHPEYRDLERAQSLLTALETRDVMRTLLSQMGPLSFSITIGAEAPDSPVKDCSVVTATFHIGGRALGNMGIVGPTRMDYARVAAVVDGVGKFLSALGESPPPGGGKRGKSAKSPKDDAPL